MRYRSILPVIVLITTTTAPVHAQHATSLLAAEPVRFERWQPAVSLTSQTSTRAVQGLAEPRRGNRHAIVGGVIGVVGGIVLCTVISNVADDSAGGFSTCTLKGYLLTGAAGLAIGFTLGSIF